MKKTIAILAAVTMVFSLVACGEPNATNDRDEREEDVTQEESETEATEENEENNTNASNHENPMEAKAELPEEFVVSEYDEEYFQPLTDDFVIVSYDVEVDMAIPGWFNNLGQMSYGANSEMKTAMVTVTKMVYFDGENEVGIKIRYEYASVEDAMTACTILDYYLVPQELGLPNEIDDSLITEDFFEDMDQQLFGTFPDTMFNGYTAIYYGHFDNLRYFEVTAPEGCSADDFYFWQSPKITDFMYSIDNTYINRNIYTAGEMLTVPRYLYQDEEAEGEMTLYSSQRSYTPPELVVNEAKTEIPEEILTLPGDAQYYTPCTEDYILAVAYTSVEGYEDYESGDAKEDITEQLTSLYSFDESGNVVQIVDRRFEVRFLTDPDYVAIVMDNSYYESMQFDEQSGAIYMMQYTDSDNAAWHTKEEVLDYLTNNWTGTFYCSQ